MVTPPITALLLSVPHVRMTEQSKSSRENKQSLSSPFKIFEISSNSKKVCAYKVAGYSFGKSLVDNL